MFDGVDIFVVFEYGVLYFMLVLCVGFVVVGVVEVIRAFVKVLEEEKLLKVILLMNMNEFIFRVFSCIFINVIIFLIFENFVDLDLCCGVVKFFELFDVYLSRLFMR